jgi:hypothetical protein
VTGKPGLRSVAGSSTLSVRESLAAGPVLLASVLVGLFGASCLVGFMAAAVAGAFRPLLLLWLLVGAVAVTLGYCLWRSGRRLMRPE